MNTYNNKKTLLIALTLTFSSVLTTSVKAGSLVGRWAMDDNTTSPVVVDNTSSNNGTFLDSTNPNTSYHHSTDYQEGTGSLSLDGVDDSIEISGYKGITGSSSRTCAAWIKTTTPSSQIINWGTYSDGQRWTVRVNTDGALRAEAHGGYIYGTTSVADGAWHHVAVVLESDGSPDISEVILYVDGTRETIGGVSPYAINTVASSDVKIGVNLIGTVFFQGLIDDVRIYDYALSVEEIHLLNPEYAWNPSPDNNTVQNAMNITVSWSAGDSAVSHDVYFGTNKSAVTSAQRLAGDINGDGPVDITDLVILADQWTTNPGTVDPSADITLNNMVDLEDFAALAETWHQTPDAAFKGNQIETLYRYSSLGSGPYYWRIDEVSGGTILKGHVWSFTFERDLYSDTWVAVDALGRALPDYSTCGPPRSDKTVALFYYIWLGEHDGNVGPYDITQIISDAGGMPVPQWNPDNPAYQTDTAGLFHHWGESELGYYRSEDLYVIRKHAHMLANAGVDVIVFDVTNGWTYKDNYMALCNEFIKIRAEGSTTPQICFMTNAYGDSVVQTIYNDLYSQNLYPELWFYWKGKPLILAPSNGMKVPDNHTINHSQQILDFFTMRYSWTWMNVEKADVWKWMDYYPQQYGWHESSSIPEQVSVSCGIVPHTNQGRSYRSGYSYPTHDQYGLTGTEDQGLCFAQQWSRLNQIDPELVFITQWNEWVAERQIAKDGRWFLGEQLSAGDTWFIDEYNQEYSRDIEPMKGGHTDNYYYQMIDGIRRYKGVRPPQASSAAKTITIDGDFTDWVDVEPVYGDHIADTTHRNWSGWGLEGVYTNTTGRNDFVNAKVARDDTYIYFYIQTASDITNWDGSRWMWLFINADQDYTDGWEGYDYLINKSVSSSTSTTLMSTSGGWNWTDVNANIAYQVSGDQMEIRVPRSDIDQGSGSDPVAFDFKWSDNIRHGDDIIEFAVSGDSAPDRRFNYRYDSEVAELIPGIYNTGVNDNGSILDDQVQDSHWTLTSSDDPTYDGPEAYTVKSDEYPLPPNGPWMSNSSISKWICPRQDNTEVDPGTYVYQLQFDLTGYVPANVKITGRYSVDDDLTNVKINGVSTGINGSGFNSWHSFTISSGFVSGTNTLEFFVNNGGTNANPCGLRVELQATEF